MGKKSLKYKGGYVWQWAVSWLRSQSEEILSMGLELRSREATGRNPW